MQDTILTPMLALILWSFVMWLWMYATRLPAMSAARIDATKIKRKSDLDPLPTSVQQIADNYNHLHEQPTIFYAIVLTLAMMGMNQPINVYLAWGYVVFRILHSMIQCTSNIVRFRFPLFGLASFCLLGLTVHAGAMILHDCLGW